MNDFKQSSMAGLIWSQDLAGCSVRLGVQVCKGGTEGQMKGLHSQPAKRAGEGEGRREKERGRERDSWVSVTPLDDRE